MFLFLTLLFAATLMELYVKNRQEWRRWLEKNHLKKDEVWLIYYKKPSGKPRIPYADAVEEALCFGWIDGKIKRINEEYYIQRFTPRRKGSRWSKYNIERIKRLTEQGLMKPEGLQAFQESIEKPDLVYTNRSDGEPLIPDDLAKALRNNKVARCNFLNLSRSGRRMFIDWLNSAKKVETRARRIEKIINMSVRNVKPGMGVI